MRRVLAFTGGNSCPSRVPRVQQYIPGLVELGIELTECPSRVGSIPPEQKWLRPVWVLGNLAEHLPAAFRSYAYDAVLLHREMLSTWVTLEPLVKRPRIFDVDDAIWVNGGGKFAQRLAILVDCIICGNSFLAENFSRWNSNVTVLPTAVDTSRFVPRWRHTEDDTPVIGWFGLSAGFQFLYGIESSLAVLMRRNPTLVLRIVSNKPPRFRFLPQEQVQFVPYIREDEVTEIQKMSVGLMPLDDSETSRGKCSFKMLQYMACGLPVVVSRVGMNAEVLQKGEVGFGVTDSREWVESIEMLVRDRELGMRMGKVGRSVVERHYSLTALLPKMAEILGRVVGRQQSLSCVAS